MHLKRIRPLTLHKRKTRPLTLCIPKIRPLTLCKPKIRLLTLCTPKIRFHKVGVRQICPRKFCAVYALHELALEEEKYRQQIAQILCSYVRSKTNEVAYQKTYTERPSNEIQTTLNLLFKEKERGLYTQDFMQGINCPCAHRSFT
jgi:hypothetical protein